MKLPRTQQVLDTEPFGLLECFGHELDEHAVATLVELTRMHADVAVSRSIDFAGHRAWFKGGPLRGRASLRHGLRRLAGRSLPRLREHANLAWLAERLFHVPRPLASGWVRRGGLPVHQFLVMHHLGRTTPLDRALAKASPEARGALIAELALEVARMHALHFVHHDLFVRNVLVRDELPAAGADHRRLVFIDTWRGGPGYLARGADYDLACLMLEGAHALTPFEQALLFRTYLAERAVQAVAPDAERLLRRVERGRAALIARIAREPSRWRGTGAPVVEWRAPRG